MYIKFKKSGGNQEIKEAGLFCEGWTVESWVGIVNKYPPPHIWFPVSLLIMLWGVWLIKLKGNGQMLRRV